MTDQELVYSLALMKVEGVGDILAKKLIAKCGSAEEVFKTKSSKIGAIDGIGSAILKKRITTTKITKRSKTKKSHLRSQLKSRTNRTLTEKNRSIEI